MARSQTETESLARLVADALAGGTMAPAELVVALRRTFDLEGVARLRRADAGCETQAAAGLTPPENPEDAPFSTMPADGRCLALA
ncbi:hypothetical protein [Streptomyces broussonetiae]|uniref:ANTAR domain-containing protein n=1 Tax=Streptomyces broussonetiae TaxID=2686304 RepID=A0A6I6NLP1_9ACTN|nr:hypothetical protein [Streptomyces broussonetiae]QHA09086.1 hypothetical protein GQF42_42955 [Streptomyces broussonetiae]